MKTEVKNIKDYLHLYAGCDVVHVPDDGTTAKLLGVVGNEVHLLNNDHNQNGIGYFDDVMPILRPLSDMTDEEIDEVWYGIEPQNVLEMEYSDGRNMRKVALCSERTRYLLSRGFDLFRLIDAGLAIDKTKLNSHGSKE